MKISFGDFSDAKTRAAKIRALFTSGSTIHEHADKCVNAGLWTESELRGMAGIQARAEVRNALGQITEEGVPWAGPTPSRKERSPIWRQMEFWSKREFDFNYSAYKRRAQANGAVADAIARVCKERFGVEPMFIDDVEDEPEI